jgi:hypothetical protein
MWAAVLTQQASGNKKRSYYELLTSTISRPGRDFSELERGRAIRARSAVTAMELRDTCVPANVP